MEVAGEALELGGQAQDKRLIQRGSPPAAPAARPADEPVRAQQLVKMPSTFGPPQCECLRCHALDRTPEH
jgi:hypothetical protein